MLGTYTLMHKDNQVCEVNIASGNNISNVIVIDERLLPPSVAFESTRNLSIELTRWLKSRVCDMTRSDIAEIIPFIDSSILRQAGKVSLLDGYWFKEKESETWENINPFDNWDSARDPICVLNLKPEYFKKMEEISSPILSLPGKETRLFLKKNNGEIFLLSPNIIQEMSFFKKNKTNPVVQKRKYLIVAGRLYVLQHIQSSKDKELFPLSELIIKTHGTASPDANAVIDCFEKFGIKKSIYLNFLKNVYEADEMIRDDSRELDTIYLVRNSNTLEFTGLAKI